MRFALLAILSALFLGAPAFAQSNIAPGGEQLSTNAGERQVLEPVEAGGWNGWEDKGSYLVGWHAGEYIAVREQGMLYVAQMPAAGTEASGGGETTATTTWTCSCHQVEHTVETTISSQFEDSDLRKHDRKLEKMLKRHPQVKPKPGSFVTPPGSKVPDKIAEKKTGGVGGLVNLPGGVDPETLTPELAELARMIPDMTRPLRRLRARELFASLLEAEKLKAAPNNNSADRGRKFRPWTIIEDLVASGGIRSTG